MFMSTKVIQEARVSFRMPAEMREALEKLAAEDNRCFSSYVKDVLSKHLKSKE